MIENLRQFPTFFQEGLAKKPNFPKNYKKIKNIVVAGMGASAIPGQISKEGLSLKAPLEVSRSYTLPSYANQDTLLICISYSGNTQETINQFNQGIKKKCKIVVITSGGILKTKAKKLKLPLIEIPTNFLPRESLPYLLSSLIKILKTLNLTKESISIKKLEKTKIEEEAKNLARKIKNSSPLICSQYSSVSFRWESQFSENSKQISKSKSIPELSHNEIESWRKLNKKHSLILLRDEKETKEIKALINGIKKIIGKKVQLLEVYGKGDNKLERILYLIWFGDFTSYFLAKENKVNPKETKYIKALKKEIKKVS